MPHETPTRLASCVTVMPCVTVQFRAGITCCGNRSDTYCVVPNTQPNTPETYGPQFVMRAPAGPGSDFSARRNGKVGFTIAAVNQPVGRTMGVGATADRKYSRV